MQVAIASRAATMLGTGRGGLDGVDIGAKDDNNGASREEQRRRCASASSASASWAPTTPACWPGCPASSWSASPIRTAASAISSPAFSAARPSTDVDALLALGVDAVTIAAPTHLHHDDRAALHRPRHPRAGREADRLHGRGGPRHHRRRPQAGVTLMVGHVERFNPAVTRDQAGDPRRGHSVHRASPASARSRRACRMSAW